MRIPPASQQYRSIQSAAEAPSPQVLKALPLQISGRFGERLRHLRNGAGMTQTDMADRFGIDRSFISEVERGHKSVGLPLLEVIAIGFRLSLSELLAAL